MGQIGFDETSVRNYHSTLRDISDEHGSRLHRSGNLKSNKIMGIEPLQDKSEGKHKIRNLNMPYLE
jgi:hypothetical protein